MNTTVPPVPLKEEVFPQYVLAKSPEVKLDGVDARLMEFLGVLGLAHQIVFQCPAVITSARDQLHGKGSKHYEGKAVDIRVSDLPAVNQDRLLMLVLVLCDRFKLTVFDERNLPGGAHFHVEVAE